MKESRPLRILYITPREPHPNGMGVERRAWQHLQGLKDLGEVDVIFTPRLVHLQKRAAEPQMWCGDCRKFAIVHMAEPPEFIVKNDTLRRFLAIPFVYSECFYRAETKELAVATEQLDRTSYDFVFCFRIRSLRIWQQLKKRHQIRADRLVVDFDDIESKASLRTLTVQGSALGRQTRWSENLRYYAPQLVRKVRPSRSRCCGALQ